MRKPSIFVRPLAPEEGMLLERMSRRAKHFSKRQRAQILLASDASPSRVWSLTVPACAKVTGGRAVGAPRRFLVRLQQRRVVSDHPRCVESNRQRRQFVPRKPFTHPASVADALEAEDYPRIHYSDDLSSITRREFLLRSVYSAAGLAGSSAALVACRKTSTETSPTASGSAMATPPPPSPPTYPETKPWGPELDDFIHRRMREAYMPSLAASVVREQDLEWAKGYGWANIEADIPADPDTVYMLASVSKTFICAAIMQLWEAGSLDLDADVGTYLPFSVRNPSHPKDKITLRMLLTHTSSIGDRNSIWGTMSDPAPTGYTHGDATMTLADFLSGYLVPSGAYYIADKDFYPTPPGEAYHYSNIGADTAAYVAEVVSGEPFGDYVRSHLLTPLGMTQSGYHLSDITTTDLAMPYHSGHPPTNDSQPYYQFGYPDYPCGTMRTSATNLSIWLRCFMNGGSYEGTQILKPATVKEIFKPQIPGNWWQGLIWYHSRNFGEELIGHSGGDYGVCTNMNFSPKRDVGVITLTNRFIGGWTAWAGYQAIRGRLFAIA